MCYNLPYINHDLYKADKGVNLFPASFAFKKYTVRKGVSAMIGERLSQLRKYLHMNKRQMARFLGIAYSSYNHYEVGDRLPPYALLLHIADELGVSTDYLLGRQQGDILNLMEREMLNSCKELNEIGQQRVLEYIKELRCIYPQKVPGSADLPLLSTRRAAK